MSNSATPETVDLLMDLDPGKRKLCDSLSDELLYTLDVIAVFKGENIRSEEQLSRKMEVLFDNVSVVNVMVVRDGWNTRFKMVVDKQNFMNLIRHDNFGSFEDDYDFLISDFHPNLEGNTSCYRAPDTPLKMVERFNQVDGHNKELTITIRRGMDPTDKPAFGMKTFNLMSDPREAIKVLEHFDLVGKIARVTKATPQRPTLQVKLTASVLETFDLNNYMDPCPIYRPSPQSVEAGETELWAHLHRSGDNQRKRLIIEGVDGVADLDEIKHRLSYHGEMLTDLEPRYWESNDDELAGFYKIPNGDYSVFMKLNIELNFVIIGRDSFRVTYQNQTPQCSYCMSWLHRIGQCDRKHLGRSALQQDYQLKWMRLVGYEERPSRSEPGETEDNEGDEAQEKTEESADKGPDAKVVKNLETAFEEQVDATNQAKLDLSSPSNILDNYSEVYGDKQGAEVAAEELPREGAETAANITLPSEAETTKDTAPIPPKPDLTGSKLGDDSVGWETAKARRKKVKKGARKGTDSNSSTSSESEGTKDSESKTESTKRKAESPKENEIKKSGSGRKKGHFAERTKSSFFTEHIKKHDEAASVGDSVVRKEKLKRELTTMEDKYYRLMFDNISGSDPEANENWNEIKKALSDTRSLLEQKPNPP